MGFRSVMMTEDIGGIEVPQWFLDKYPYFDCHQWVGENMPSMAGKKTLPVWSKFETKWYGVLKEDERLVDIQKILVENLYEGKLSVVLLHECGGITLVFVSQDKIEAREPEEWKDVDSVEHNYCYGCSKPKEWPAPSSC